MSRSDELTDGPVGADAVPSFEDFARAAGPALLRFGHVLTGQQASAEDLTQETLIRVGLAWRRIRRDADPLPYARRTMLNVYLNDRRKLGREVLEPDAGLRLPPVAAVDPMPLAAVLELLDRLPRRQRAAVAMRHVLDLDDRTIAAELGCSISTVRSQISRGLATLRVSLTAHSATEGHA